MSKEELIKQILGNVEFSHRSNNPSSGGQTVGIVRLTDVIYSAELNLRIETEWFRDRKKNREFLMKMMEFAVDELIDNN